MTFKYFIFCSLNVPTWSLLQMSCHVSIFILLKLNIFCHQLLLTEFIGLPFGQTESISVIYSSLYITLYIKYRKFFKLVFVSCIAKQIYISSFFPNSFNAFQSDLDYNILNIIMRKFILYLNEQLRSDLCALK